jgi:hypothetical protein
MVFNPEKDMNGAPAILCSLGVMAFVVMFYFKYMEPPRAQKKDVAFTNNSITTFIEQIAKNSQN